MENKTESLFHTNSIMEGNVLVIQPPPRLDASVSQKLKEIFSSGINHGTYNFVVDFAHTDFIDSSGLGALVSKISVCRTNNGDIILTSISSQIKEVFRITHLDKILKCFDNLDEAIESIKTI